MLMLALYKILLVDPEESDDSMKKLIYQMSYMDNLAISTEDEDKLNNYYGEIPEYFEQYCFPLQQFVIAFHYKRKLIVLVGKLHLLLFLCWE